MTTDNNLFSTILASGRAQAEEIEKEAQAQRAAILDDARAEAESEAAAVLNTAKKKAEGIKQSAFSSAALLKRNTNLNAKRAEINAVIDGICNYLEKLDDESYFALLYKMAGQIHGKGEILLNAHDLARVPADFTERMKAAGVDAALSDMTADIDGGFVLKDGAIEMNCSFAAMIEDKRDEIEDFINRALFEQEGD